MMKRLWLLVVLSLILAGSAACGGGSKQPQEGSKGIAFSTTPAATAGSLGHTPGPSPAPVPASPPPSPVSCNPSAVPSSLKIGNLVPNPSLEDGTSGWVRVRFDGARLPVVLDSTVSHGGNCSIRLSRHTTGDCTSICGYWNSPAIPVDPSKTYRFSVWFKGSQSLAGRAAFASEFRVFDASGNSISTSGFVQGITADWKETSSSNSRFPANAASVIIDLAWTGSVSQDFVEGELWIDDVFLGPIP